MKSFVITIMDNEKSVSSAKRCIKSGKKYGIDIEMWEATTPKDDPKSILIKKGINPQGFIESYSRLENCMAAFCSHHSLWEKCLQDKEDILIFEHDAVVKLEIPNVRGYKGCISFGAPSYGKFNTPRFIGVQELQSKPYFPGAHAYQVSWQAAEVLIKTAKSRAAPTDVFLNKNSFPFLQEYYPWPVVCADNFTTIQNERGCYAKHNFGETYEIL